MKKYTLGVIGGGFMARAILSGAFSKKILNPKEVLVCDPSAECRAYFTSVGADVSEHNLPAVQNCRYLLFAVKPQNFAAAIEELRGQQFPVVISIMAGKTIAGIQAATGTEKIARVMPNLPCSIGAGMSAVDASRLGNEDRNFVLGLFLSVGEVIETAEEQLNAVTAVSGSGPAYIYLFLRAFINAAMEQGLREEQARTLVFQTMEGGLSMAKTPPKSLDELIAAVSSKGGTTVAALESFARDGFDAAVSRAVAAARQRAEELSE